MSRSESSSKKQNVRGQKRTSVTLKRGTALNEAQLECKLEKNNAIAMMKTASRQAAQTISYQDTASVASAGV